MVWLKLMAVTHGMVYYGMAHIPHGMVLLACPLLMADTHGVVYYGMAHNLYGMVLHVLVDTYGSDVM
jgi:hypothetical protein